ncbi:MAG: hypothetical protein AAFV07_14770 [Bacteroidota bacterium]
MLIQLVRTLDPAEFKQWGRFVHAAYFNTHKNTARLYDYLARYYPELTAPHLKSEIVFEALFPGQPYRDDWLRTLRKYLLQLLSEFLGIHRFREDPVWLGIFKVTALQEKAHPAMFERQLKRINQSFKQDSPQSETNLLQGFYLADLQFTHHVQQDHQQALADLQIANQRLDHFYLWAKLRLLCGEINLRTLVGAQPYESEPVTLLWPYLEAQLATFPAPLQAYIHAAHFLSGRPDEESAYLRLRELLGTSANGMEHSDLLNFYGFAVNYAYRAYRRGQPHRLQDMLDLYREMLALNLLIEGGHISEANYRNITTLSLRLGEYEWGANFVEGYKPQLPENIRDSAYRYNLAHVYYYQRHYGMALKLMQWVAVSDVFYALSFRVLQLKIYFDQQEIEVFYSHVQSTRIFIRRLGNKQVPPSRREAYRNFVKLARQIFRLKHEGKGDSDQILTEISQADYLVEKEWLLAKMES